MVIPQYPPDWEHNLPDETPEALQRIAERLQQALNELFAVKAEAAELAKSTTLPAEVERVLTAASKSGEDAQRPAAVPADQPFDRRLYLPRSEGWELCVKSGPREYCYYRNPGEEWFHLLVDGELYLRYGQEKLCLNCAFRHGILTDNRLFWQTGRRRPRRSTDEADDFRRAEHVSARSPDEDEERST